MINCREITMKELYERTQALKLYGFIAHWDDLKNEPLIEKIIEWEENERLQRGLLQRIKRAKIDRFKPIADFDWSWPKKCDRELVEELLKLNFLQEANNLIFCGPNGVGKTTFACNIANQAVLAGHSVLFTTAPKMLSELAAQDGDNALRRRIQYYTKPTLLVIDEVGYLSYSNRYADLLFEIISTRYEKRSTIITTNKPFSEWKEMFPNAAYVVSLIDRLVHHSEIISIDADSFRFKEAKEKMTQRKTKSESRDQ
jgi:DNA replication protein DnaC